MKRLDAALVELKLAPTRSKAQQIIEAGECEVLKGSAWQVVRQASFQLREVSLSMVRIAEHSQILKYVSRGGLKMEAALKHVDLSPSAWRCLDVGISTGGFTDCLLQAGATEVVGIDVGHEQLHPKLTADKRVKHFEGVNARELVAFRKNIAPDTQLCVVDVSFISLQQIVPALAEVLPAQCRLLALVKPQFEVGAAALDKNGIVRDESLFTDVKTNVLRVLEKYGFSTQDYFACEVKGQDGNQEFFVYALRR